MSKFMRNTKEREFSLYNDFIFTSFEMHFCSFIIWFQYDSLILNKINSQSIKIMSMYKTSPAFSMTSTSRKVFAN